jgi:ribose transport system ATP-binding protein
MIIETSSPRLRASNVSKTFGSTRVLNGLDMLVQPGEIHGLVGENGSGKSTFVKMLTGYHPCDDGATIEIDGRPVATPVQWDEIHRAGVSVVHQDFGLIDHLTVAENISVGGYGRNPITRKINWSRQIEIAEESLARINSTVSPMALVGTLPVSRRAAVAMARALRDLPHGSGLVILDESTRSLSRDELLEFYEALGREVKAGTSVLLVSHSLLEVKLVTDRVTVLRDGVVTGRDLVTDDYSEGGIARLMLGKHVGAVTREAARTHRRAAVRVESVSGDTVPPISFNVGEGEIVGITGLTGSGFESIPYLLTGARRASGGFIEVGGKRVELKHASVRICSNAGIALVPERRDRDGLAFDVSVRDNVALPTASRLGHWWFLPRRWQRVMAMEMSDRLGIRPRDPSLLVRQLSGGNQQKVLIAKWLTVGPRLLVLHEPTQAVDVGARHEILKQMQRISKDGVSVILVSVETMDLVEVCDRILVYSATGLLAETASREPDEILGLVYGRSEV